MELSRSEIVAAHDLGEALLRFLKAWRLLTASEETKQRVPDSGKPDFSAAHEQILFTPREAAKALRMSEKTLWSMTAPRGPIRSVRLGRSVRYLADDLRQAVSQSKVN